MNPRHQADAELTYHATHVAGTAIGTGGPEGIRNGAEPGFNAGLAPDARLVDCKGLSDAGVGFGSADALEWMIYHKFDSWGLTGADTVYRGIDVANLSLGGTDASDGSDADCAAVNAAHKAGIVVCVASGNDGNTNYMPSPAAADFALTVGAFTDDNTVNRLDDYVADYSNEGPRMADSDGDHLDEMKPNVMGSGTGINSALGDPTSDGRHYHHINGTSMATPTITGVVALVRSANPTLSADQVRQILMDTADHRRDRGQQPPSAADPFGIDPNYHPSWGWGQVDAYAAVKEAQNPASTQVIRIQATPQRGPDGFQIGWTSQREVGLARYELDRAPDQSGAPGAWTTIDQVPVASPSMQIHAVPNRHPYGFTDLDPGLSASAYYWYRVRWIDVNGASHAEPPIRTRIVDSPVVARVRYSWTHDYSDGDLYVRFGTGTSTFAPQWFRQGLGAQSADSFVVHPGVSYTGTHQYYFHVDLTADDMVGGYLPPSAANPWFLSVKEGGYVNTKGTVNDFSVTVFDGAGATTYAAPNPPTQTVEKQETTFWVPLDPATSPNHAPVLAPIGPRSIGEGLTLAFFANASDADNGQALTYSASGLPSGATFDANTRQFGWTPGFSAAGAYSVRFRVRDNALPIAAADSEDVTITVADRNPNDNLPPRLDPLTDRQGVVGEAMQFRITGHDPEGAALGFSATGLPTGATLDAVSGLFAWTPQPGQSGLHPVTFRAADPQSAADTASVFLVVSDPGAAAPPPGPCNAQSFVQDGIVDSGIDPISVSYSYQSFAAVLVRRFLARPRLHPARQRFERGGWIGQHVQSRDHPGERAAPRHLHLARHGVHESRHRALLDQDRSVRRADHDRRGRDHARTRVRARSRATEPIPARDRDRFLAAESRRDDAQALRRRGSIGVHAAERIARRRAPRAGVGWPHGHRRDRIARRLLQPARVGWEGTEPQGRDVELGPKAFRDLKRPREWRSRGLRLLARFAVASRLKLWAGTCHCEKASSRETYAREAHERRRPGIRPPWPPASHGARVRRGRRRPAAPA